MLAGVRAGLGVAALAAPTVVARPWVGRDARLGTVRVLGRALGARDLALGLGALLALRRDRPTRGWIEAGGLADMGDLVATLVGFRSLPRYGRWLVLAAAGAGAASSFALALAAAESRA